jgi:hypothetical protein
MFRIELLVNSLQTRHSIDMKYWYESIYFDSNINCLQDCRPHRWGQLGVGRKPTAAYLSNVNVRVQDAKGQTLISTVSNGPWFSAKLPAGNYRVTATFENYKYIRSINLAQRPQILVLSWTV